MKFIRRCCSLLALSLVLSTAFSSLAHAETIEGGTYKVSATFQDDYDLYYSYEFTPSNGEEEKHQVTTEYRSEEKEYTFSGSYAVTMIDGSPIVEKGAEATITFENVYYSLYVDTLNRYYRTPSWRALIHYIDGRTEYANVQTYTNGAIQNIDLTFEPSANVKKIEFLHTQTALLGSSKITYTSYVGEYNGDMSHVLTVTQKSAEEGLLSGLIEWVRSIWENVKEIPSLLNSVWETIKALPSQLWDLISEGLHSLFVPSEEFLVQFRYDIEAVISNKFGLIYDAMDLIDSFIWGVLESNEGTTDTIQIPELSIDLLNGDSFTFGGWEVDIVPKGEPWETILDMTKALISALCTLAFAGAMRRRYEEVFR